MATTSIAVERALQHETITIVPWSDPVVDQLGHEARSAYVERFWLPILGPSTVAFLRNVATRLESQPKGFSVHLGSLARELGLGEPAGPNAPFARTLSRAVSFAMARLDGDLLEVRRALPPLARRHLARLPDSLRAAHTQLAGSRPGAGANPARIALRERGRHLALSLLHLGEAPPAVAAQLVRWRYSPELADECVAWAMEQGRTNARGA